MKVFIRVKLVDGRDFIVKADDFIKFVGKLREVNWIILEDNESAIQTDKITSCEVVTTVDEEQIK